jgi:ketosteroid isomerase-like protein
MSQENVELIRTWYLQFPALNSEALDFMYEHVWDSAIDWRAMAGAPDDLGPIEGRDAMRRYNEELLEIFEDIVLEAEEIIDGGEDRVIVVLRMTGRARLSGVETDMRFAVLCVLRDGRIVRGREYATKEEALEAMGLSEQDAHADS